MLVDGKSVIVMLMFFELFVLSATKNGNYFHFVFSRMMIREALEMHISCWSLPYQCVYTMQSENARDICYTSKYMVKEYMFFHGKTQSRIF